MKVLCCRILYNRFLMVSPIEITVKATEKQNKAFRVYLA